MLKILKIMDDTTFYNQMCDASFPVQQFNHKAHVRLAWICLSQSFLEEAIVTIQTIIINYVRHYGAEDKYHVTLTVAAAKIINGYMRSNPSQEFDQFVSDNPAILNDFKGLIAQHYSGEIWTNEIARTSYVEPDIIGFDK